VCLRPWQPRRLTTAVALPAPLRTPDAASPVDWVNTYIGTGGGGSDYGGPCRWSTTPLGTTNWTAQTRQTASVSSYAFEDDTISGLSERISLQSGWAIMAM